MPRLRETQIDGQALGFTILIAVASALIFGLVPALRASRTGVGEALKQTASATTIGTGWRRYRSALVVTELALTLVLLAGGGFVVPKVAPVLYAKPGVAAAQL